MLLDIPYYRSNFAPSNQQLNNMDFKSVLKFFQKNVSDPGKLIEAALKTLGEGGFILDMVKNRLAIGDNTVLSWFDFNDQKSVDELFFAIDFFGIKLTGELQQQYLSYIRSRSYNEELFLKMAKQYDKDYWNKLQMLKNGGIISDLS